MNIKKISPYGGGNKNPNPFPVNTKIRQKKGTEEWEIIGYKDDQMLMRPLNEDAFFGVDTLASRIIEYKKSFGTVPDYTKVLQLHYRYADRFEVIP